MSAREIAINLGIALIAGVVAGVVASYIWTRHERSQRRKKNAEHFAWMNGLYSITRKRERDAQHYKASVVVVDNVLRVEYQGLPPGDWVRGEIVMSERSPRSGSGDYLHLKRGEQLGGFWELRALSPNTFLVHTEYAHPERFEQVVQAAIWERISPSSASCEGGSPP